MEVKNTKKEMTRKNILEAAKAHFIDFGYKDTLVSDIAQFVHLDRRTIYRYFPTKESLLVHITANQFEDFTTKVLEFPFEETDNAMMKFKKLLDFYYEYIKEKPDMIILLGMVDTNVGSEMYNREDFEVLDRHGKILDKVLEEIITEGQSQGLMKTDQSPKDYAVTINNSLIALATRTAIYVPNSILKQQGYTWTLLQIQGDILTNFLEV